MSARALIIAGFAALVLLVVAADLVARRPGSQIQPLPDTLAAAMRTRAGRVVVFSAWLWLGWHFLAR